MHDHLNGHDQAAAPATADCAGSLPKAAQPPYGIPGGPRRWFDHREGDGSGCRDRPDSLAGLPAARDQAAGEDAGIPAPHGGRSRHQPAQHADVHDRLRRRWHRGTDWREVCAGSDGSVAGRRETASRSVFGDRAGRTGREDHRLQGRRRNRAQEENSVDERQVRGRHRARSSTRSTPS